MYTLIQDQRIFMNSYVEFSAWTEVYRSKVHAIFDQGFQQFHFVIEKFTRFESDSELSQLNRSEGKKKIVSRELFNLVQYGLNLAEKTEGYFDPTIIDFLEAYGYGARYQFEKLKRKEYVLQEVQNIARLRSTYKDIALNKSDLSIKLAPKQRIDLGGLGKGYAIDLAYEKLKGLGNFVINAGGDIRVMGNDRDGTPWFVGLNVPELDSLGYVQLENKALCCSGAWARKVKFFHHLLNPKTGKPQDDVHAVFVISDDAMSADSWATALFAMGKKAPEYIEKYELCALLVYKNEKVEKFRFPKIVKEDV